MIGRHVLCNRIILSPATGKTSVAGNPGPFIVNFYYFAGEPDIDSFVNIAERYGIILVIYGYMVIKLHRGFPPFCILIRETGQRLEKRKLFGKKYGIPASILLLERRFVEFLKQPVHS